MPSFGWRLARRLLKQRRTWRIWRCWELGQPLLPRWITRPGWGSVQASRGAYMSTRTFYVNWDYHASVLLPLWCAVLKNLNLHASCSWFFRSSLATEKSLETSTGTSHKLHFVKSCNSDFVANVFPSAWMFTCMDHVGQFSLPDFAVLPPTGASRRQVPGNADGRFGEVPNRMWTWRVWRWLVTSFCKEIGYQIISMSPQVIQSSWKNVYFFLAGTYWRDRYAFDHSIWLQYPYSLSKLLWFQVARP